MIKFIDYFYPLQKLSNNYLETYETKKQERRKRNGDIISGVILLIYIFIMICI